MAITFTTNISDQVSISPAATIGNGSTVSGYIESIVCGLTITDDEANISTDIVEAVPLTHPHDKAFDDFVPLDQLTEMPQSILDQLDVWFEDENRRSALEVKLENLKLRSIITTAPWSNQE